MFACSERKEKLAVYYLSTYCLHEKAEFSHQLKRITTKLIHKHTFPMDSPTNPNSRVNLEKNLNCQSLVQEACDNRQNQRLQVVGEAALKLFLVDSLYGTSSSAGKMPTRSTAFHSLTNHSEDMSHEFATLTWIKTLDRLGRKLGLDLLICKYSQKTLDDVAGHDVAGVTKALIGVCWLLGGRGLGQSSVAVFEMSDL